MSELLTAEEIVELTGYRQATKQLNALHARGFARAYINREGKVRLERPHYDAVCRGELIAPKRSANLSHIRKAA